MPPSKPISNPPQRRRRKELKPKTQMPNREDLRPFPRKGPPAESENLPARHLSLGRSRRSKARLLPALTPFQLHLRSLLQLLRKTVLLVGQTLILLFHFLCLLLILDLIIHNPAIHLRFLIRFLHLLFILIRFWRLFRFHLSYSKFKLHLLSLIPFP